MMNITEVGQHIRQRRKELDVDQVTVAELAGISVHTLSDMESGKANPTIETLSKVLDVLGLELAVRAKSR